MDCLYCGKTFGPTAVFCQACGNKLTAKVPRKVGGVQSTQGMYKIVATTTIELRSDDHADEVARYATFGEEEYGANKIDIEFIRSTCPRETHPYICITCEKDNMDIVVEDTDTYCEWCDGHNWKERDEDE